MKVLLINPPSENEIMGNNPPFVEEERGYNPPLGLLYMAGYLEKFTEYSVEVLDTQVEELDYPEIEDIVREKQPEVVGITAMTFTLIDVIKTVNLIKSVNKLEVETEIWPISAAAAPLSKIQEVLGLNYVAGGLGIGGSAHSANEFIQYSSINNTRLSYYYFLQEYSQLYKERKRS